MKCNAAVLLLLFSLFVVLPGCGGGGGGNASSGNPPATVALPAQFKDTPLLSGQGHFNNLVLSVGTLFWGDGDSGKGIWKCTKDGASPQLLVQKLFQASNMVVHGSYAYWISTDPGRIKFSIYRTTLDGSQTTLMTTGNAPFPFAYLAADDKALYFTATDNTSYATNTASVVLQKFPLDGSTPTTLYHVVGGATGIAADDNFIYVLDKTGADSFAANLVRISKTDGSSQTLSQNIAQVDGALAVANGAIFVGTYGSLLKVPAAGGTPTVLATGNVEPYSPTVFQDTIYWMNYNRNATGSYTIQSVPVGGGNTAIVAANVSQPSHLVATTDGLYWSESQSNVQAYARALKALSWQSGQVTTVAGGMCISSLAVSGAHAYVTQYNPGTGYSEISSVALADGGVHLLLGGLNTSPYTFCATSDSLIIGDGSAVKKVPISGGLTSTLASDSRFAIREVKDQGGNVYFTSGGTKAGVFKVSDAGGPYVPLAQEPGLYSTIVSIQDGYVYYVLSQSNNSGGTNAELRRVRTDGSASSESYFKVPAQYALVQFDGIGTVYLTQWIYNDQYKYLKYDVATGNVVELFSGTWMIIGVDSSYLFFADFQGNVYRIPKNGGERTYMISVPYPLELQSHWVPSGSGVYFLIAYLDPTKGYLSEIDYLEQTN